MPRKSKKSMHEDLLAEARALFDKSVSGEDTNRGLSREDRRFTIVDQHDNQHYSNNTSKPRLQINRVHHAIQQLIGEYARNQITTKVRPSDSGATPKIAETYDGLMRNIYNKSQFTHVQNDVFKEVATMGFGAWRVINEFTNQNTFEQQLMVESIPDAINSVWFDPTDKDALKRNSRYCFITADIDRDYYRDLYPESSMNSFERVSNVETTLSSSWATSDSIRVAEYFYKKKGKRKIVQTSDGKIYGWDDIKDMLEPMTAQGVVIVNERTIDVDEVWWCKINGTEILEEPVKLEFSSIPVVPVYGYSTWFEERHVFYGLPRMAKDAQRLYNYSINATLESIVNSPLDPIFITPESVAGHEDSYASANVRNTPFLFWNPDEGQPQPFRIGAPTVQSGLIEQANRAERDIQATLGRSDAAVGELPSGYGGVASGAALAGAQKQSNLGQEILFQNMGRAVEYTGELLVKMIPHIYSAETQIRILNLDGSSEFVPVNQTVMDVETAEMKMVNDLSQGEYDVEVTLSPSFETQRQETVAMLQTLASNNPAFLDVTADILARSMDFPEAAEITKRVRQQMLQQGIVQPNEEEAKQMAEAAAKQQPDIMEEIALKQQQLNLEVLAAQIDHLEAQTVKLSADMAKTHSETELTEAKTAGELNDIVTSQIKAGMEQQQQALTLLNEQLGGVKEQMQSQLQNVRQNSIEAITDGYYMMDDGTVLEVTDGEVVSMDDELSGTFSQPPQGGEVPLVTPNDIANGVEGV